MSERCKQHKSTGSYIMLGVSK